MSLSMSYFPGGGGVGQKLSPLCGRFVSDCVEIECQIRLLVACLKCSLYVNYQVLLLWVCLYSLSISVLTSIFRCYPFSVISMLVFVSVPGGWASA